MQKKVFLIGCILTGAIAFWFLFSEIAAVTNWRVGLIAEAQEAALWLLLMFWWNQKKFRVLYLIGFTMLSALWYLVLALGTQQRVALHPITTIPSWAQVINPFVFAITPFLILGGMSILIVTLRRAQ